MAGANVSRGDLPAALGELGKRVRILERALTRDGIRYDFPNEGGWLYVGVNDETELTGSAGGYALEFVDGTDSGGIHLKTDATAGPESGSPFLLESAGDLDALAAGGIHLEAETGINLLVSSGERISTTSGDTANGGEVFLEAYNGDGTQRGAFVDLSGGEDAGVFEIRAIGNVFGDGSNVYQTKREGPFSDAEYRWRHDFWSGDSGEQVLSVFWNDSSGKWEYHVHSSFVSWVADLA